MRSGLPTQDHDHEIFGSMKFKPIGAFVCVRKKTIRDRSINLIKSMCLKIDKKLHLFCFS